MNKTSLLIALLGSLAATAQAQTGALGCASSQDAARVKEFYEKKRPGAPLPVANRALDAPELVIASGLPQQQSIGISATPQITKDIWKSIDAWGTQTKVKLVLTSGGKHAFAFPSLVPITQPDDNSGMLDVYADNGDGVHAHIQLQHVKAIYATDLPGTDAGKRTRTVSFYGQDGQLIVGVYASIAKDPFDPKAVAGFEKTWQLIKSMPRACTG